MIFFIYRIPLTAETNETKNTHIIYTDTRPVRPDSADCRADTGHRTALPAGGAPDEGRRPRSVCVCVGLLSCVSRVSLSLYGLYIRAPLASGARCDHVGRRRGVRSHLPLLRCHTLFSREHGPRAEAAARTRNADRKADLEFEKTASKACCATRESTASRGDDRGRTHTRGRTSRAHATQ